MATIGAGRRLLITVIAGLAVLVSAGTAHAATITPDTFADEAGGDADNGNCALREAVISANTDTSEDACTQGDAGADTINLGAGTYTLDVAGATEDAAATGDLDVLDHLTIDGAGQGSTTIQQTTADRVLQVIMPSDADQFTLEDLTITGGDLVDDSGGGIYFDDDGIGTLRRVTVTGNTAATAMALDLNGGGIYFEGAANPSMTIEDSTISSNTVSRTDGDAAASPKGGGVSASGGSQASLTITRSTVGPTNQATVTAATTGGAGGGLFALVKTVTIEDTTFVSNSAPTGGGIFRTGGTTTDIRRTTIRDNSSTQSSGGGLVIFADVTIENSTISGNTATADGGGLRASGSTTKTLDQVTVADNAATGAGDGLSNVTGTIELERTILDNTGGDNCSGGGTYTTLGDNLAATAEEADCGLDTATMGDIQSTDPELQTLADNGGETETQAILAASLARDAVSFGGCPGTSAEDQRTIVRPGGGSSDCDIGAYEYSQIDNDGVEDGVDNCPDDDNADQANNDGDAQGDVCDPDDDNDSVNDGADNCQFTANADQANNDGDAQGDACDPDDDNDSVNDGADNCQFTANANQANNDGDAQGDVCDADDDNDTVADAADNCPKTANASQADADGDGTGDACDPTPHGTDVTLELTGKKKLKAGKPVKVTATCPSEPCEVTARATFKVPKAALTAGGKKKFKTKKVTESLVAGVGEKLKLKLKGKAKRKVKAAAAKKRFRKKTKVIVKATATDLGGNTDTAKLKLKLK